MSDPSSTAEAPDDLALQAAAPALWEALTLLGRSLRLPDNFLPQQTADARGKAFNATIGQITDGRGRAVPLSPLADALTGLGDDLRNRALLYTPVEGLADLRRLWRERRPLPPGVPAALPIVTAGPVQALSLLADLFLRPGRTVILAEGWPDGGEIFTLHTGARAVSADGPDDLAGALSSLSPEEPVVVALRSAEPAWSATLLAAAERRSLVVALDESEIVAESLYPALAGRHRRLLVFQVESAAAFGFAGGGLGFLTLPFDPGTDAARILEDKVKILLRATVGSPPAASQAVLLRALPHRLLSAAERE